ncbi:hypothetical protein PILCRDRAFT_818288 [Piloderma croceum F 1598]|uniref:Uncharacterized protein n=1 Tax=Piloderma croceum (strain F 1598) TaxID=765440 RepID=A0A0C3FYF7_PILCF|nr:hypothetical protein PILCRDRAFT_818288 [Piloderma croceum F 1598]
MNLMRPLPSCQPTSSVYSHTPSEAVPFRHIRQPPACRGLKNGYNTDFFTDPSQRVLTTLHLIALYTYFTPYRTLTAHV